MPHESRTTLTDATAMRVLAHPTRLHLLGLLRERGPQTAAHLGDAVDEAPGTISYHLGKLASIGLIEQTDQGTDRRERWWRATTDLTAWEPADQIDDPTQLQASTALQRAIGQAYLTNFMAYLDAVPTMPREWVAAAASSDRSLHLTVEQLAELRADLESVVSRFVDASTVNQAAATPGAELVTLVYQAYRRPEA
ncbi:ArsR/SmtB family transcription factor [Frigoribacterium sp. 2-23]|uniref:ArsR/SmtB family transcription factor n=1 Tax=Frigoribacterium sp. 2-23 TaxID=3415006 RepID=UPI003C7000FF